MDKGSSGSTYMLRWSRMGYRVMCDGSNNRVVVVVCDVGLLLRLVEEKLVRAATRILDGPLSLAKGPKYEHTGMNVNIVRLSKF